MHLAAVKPEDRIETYGEAHREKVGDVTVVVRGVYGARGDSYHVLVLKGDGKNRDERTPGNVLYKDDYDVESNGGVKKALAEAIKAGKNWIKSPAGQKKIQPKKEARMNMERLAELRHERRLAELRMLTAEPRYRDYLRRYKGPGAPMSKDDWEAKIFGKGDEKKPEPKKEERAPVESKPTEKTPAPADPKQKVSVPKDLGEILSQWHDNGSDPIYEVSSNAYAGKQPTAGAVHESLTKIEGWLSNWDTKAKANGWDDKDKKSLTKAVDMLKKSLPKAEKKPAAKSYSKKYNKTVTDVMDKHNLTDDDADEIKKHKGKLFNPKAKERMTDAERMRKFLSMAKPETKERMKGMSPAEFMKILGAIMDDDGEQASPKFANTADMRKQAGTLKYEGNTAIDKVYACTDLLNEAQRQADTAFAEFRAAKAACLKVEEALKKASKA